jgi:hypothetical protein
MKDVTAFGFQPSMALVAVGPDVPGSWSVDFGSKPDSTLSDALAENFHDFTYILKANFGKVPYCLYLCERCAKNLLKLTVS